MRARVAVEDVSVKVIRRLSSWSMDQSIHNIKNVR